MIRTGIIGPASSLENIIKNILSFPEFLITGYFNNGVTNPIPCLKNINIRHYRNPEELIFISDVIIISDQPGDLIEIIQKVLKNSKHILIFPDITLTPLHLETFVKLAEEAGVFLFLYHEDLKIRLPEIIRKFFIRPEFIDIYRTIGQPELSFSGNIFDNLYKELCLVMKLNPLNPRKYFTTSIPYYSSEPNFLNTRIEFENGTSANVTINKFADKSERKVEIFRKDRMVSIYPESGELNIIRKKPDKKESFKHSNLKTINFQKEGLGQFLNHLMSGNITSDPHETGVSAHNTAIGIIHQLIPVTENSLI